MDVALDHTTERGPRGLDEGEWLRLDGPQGEGDPLEVLQAVSLAVCRAPELAAGLNEALDHLLRLMDAESGTIHLAQDETEELRLVASRGLSDRFWQLEYRIPVGACRYGDSFINDPRLDRPACLDERIGALVAVPCRSQGRTVGLLTLYASARGAFAGVDRALLHAIGLHVGTAIDNAVWGAAMRESAVADERRVIASELHDGVAQSLAYLNLQVRRVQELLDRGASDGAIRELETVRNVIQSTSDDVRHLLADFRIAPAEPGSFGTALQKQVDVFEVRTGIRTELVGASEAEALSFGQQAEVLRIVQEALANVRKHAQATTVRIACDRADGWCRVRVTDNGVGLAVARLGDPGGLHAGTSIIRERAARLHGHVTIESQAGQGTTVTVAVPAARDDERRS